MDKKARDFVFASLMLLVGIYVIYESGNMLERAARPPYRITTFGISPAMLPLVLGCGLILFCLFQLAAACRGGGENSPARHLATASRRFVAALGDKDVISMIVCSVIMFVYTFFVVGRVPYWLGSTLFLIVLTGYLRASRWRTILLVSGASVALIILLFQTIFRTTLP